MKQVIKRIARRIAGIDEDPWRDLSPATRATIEASRPYTLTSIERLAATCSAVEHVVAHSIQGAFVECGVWKGGSSMAAALTFARLGETRDLFLFDTYDGMSEPTADDFDSATGETAEELLNAASKDEMVWCLSALDEVKRNLASTGYPLGRVHFIQGKVEDTIPQTLPEKIAILRLDTDFYESTRHELEHLYPRLVEGGILIIDDYGHWAGARKAVDEYVKRENLRLFLCRTDYTGRIAVKVV